MVKSIPVAGDVCADAQVRLSRLAKVVDWAREQVEKTRGLHDGSSVLKIFVAPEFYLRPPSSALTGPTPYATYPDVEAMKILTALNKMFEDKRFAHWLFVCGTVLWNTSTDRISPTVYCNTAVLVRGGRPDGMWTVEKRLASGRDGVPVESAPGKDPKTRRYLESWSNRKKNVFHVDGIRCGIEVCIDHAASRTYPATLKQTLRVWNLHEGQSLWSRLFGAAAQGVRLQILTAGGMNIDPSSVAANPDGFILRNDGMTTGKAPSEMRRVTHYIKPNGAKSARFEPEPESMAEMSSRKPFARLEVPSNDNMRIPIPKGYDDFAQRISIFSPECIV